MHLGDHYIALNIYSPGRGEMQDMSGTVCWGGGGGGGGRDEDRGTVHSCSRGS